MPLLFVRVPGLAIFSQQVDRLTDLAAGDIGDGLDRISFITKVSRRQENTFDAVLRTVENVFRFDDLA